jgi:type IV pilus assembly protein PilX
MKILPPHRPHRGAASTDRGFVMITGLLFLIVITLLSLAMFRSFGLQERIAGNTRDKQRAFEAAQNALQYGEWWLAQGSAAGTLAGTGTACTGVVDGNTVSAMRVCSDPVATTASLPAVRTDYRPPGITIGSGGTTGDDVNYATKPALYISYLGMAPVGQAVLYQVTGFGFGGNPDTMSVVQSTYQIKHDDVTPLDQDKKQEHEE